MNCVHCEALPAKGEQRMNCVHCGNTYEDDDWEEWDHIITDTENYMTRDAYCGECGEMDAVKYTPATERPVLSVQETGSAKWALDIAIDTLSKRHPHPGDVAWISIYHLNDLRVRLDPFKDHFIRAQTKENSK